MRIKVEKTNRHNKRGWPVAKITIGSKVRNFGVSNSFDDMLSYCSIEASNRPFNGAEYRRDFHSVYNGRYYSGPKNINAYVCDKALKQFGLDKELYVKFIAKS
jgi:hypothetical protein